MKEMFGAFAKKLFGVGYERLKKTVLIFLMVYWGLHIAGIRVGISPFILYLMVSTFSAGVMWQALSSDDNRENMENLFMLPFERKKLIFSYVSALGSYTFFTKTAGLMAVALGISSFSGWEIAGGIFCAASAILMAACVYVGKKHLSAALFWAVSYFAVIFLLGNSPVFLPLLCGNILLAGLVLAGTDAYLFYAPARYGRRKIFHGGGQVARIPSARYFLTWRYLFRYLIIHKNYLANTVVLWGAAFWLPVLLGEFGDWSVMPVGFAVLSFNTPICILLSADPDLERAVRFLPGQNKAFCVPYCLFIFLFHMTAEVIFLCGWEIRIGLPKTGGAGIMVVLLAVFFALVSAAGSVLLEWFCPVRGWKIESDLWHHPRKYVVPAAMLLSAGAVSLFF